MAVWSLDVNTYPVMVKANSRLVADSRKNRTRDIEESKGERRAGGRSAPRHWLHHTGDAWLAQIFPALT